MSNVTVIGAGVIGLTTALLLQRDGFNVTIVSVHFPGEYHGLYTSPWAGAHWRSYAEKNQLSQIKRDEITFKKFLQFSQSEEKERIGIMLVDAFDYWDDSKWEDPWFKSMLLENGLEYRHLRKDELPYGIDSGIKYQSLCINAPKYLDYLLHQFTTAGGKTRQSQLTHIKDAALEDTDIIINATGLHARDLGGVEDDTVYSARGQVVIIKAPHIKWTMERNDGTSGTNGLGDGGVITYVIPRDNGEVVLGGTYLVDDYNTTAIPETAEQIIRRCLVTRPDIWSDIKEELEIIRHCVGLRPVRKDGIRLETEYIKNDSGKKVLICHNYGHGSYGFQSSWGSAEEAVELVKKALK